MRILIATLAAHRGALVESRAANIKCAAFEIDRPTLCIRAGTVVKVVSVSAQRAVAREGAAGNDYVSRTGETGEAAAKSIQRGVIV